MRNMVKILTAGTLVFVLTAGVAFGDGTVTGPTLMLKNVSQKVAAPGSTITAEIWLENATDLGALQVMPKAVGGDSGSVSVAKVVMNEQHPQDVFAGVQSIRAVDDHQNRAGIAALNGGKDVVSGYVATVSFEFSDNASGTFSLNLDKGQETFLRTSSATAMNTLFGDAVTVIVSERAPTSRESKKKRGSN